MATDIKSGVGGNMGLPVDFDVGKLWEDNSLYERDDWTTPLWMITQARAPRPCNSRARASSARTPRGISESNTLRDCAHWQEPDLNNLVMYLQRMRVEIDAAPDQVHRICFSRRQIEAARAAFSRMVQRGEMRLHRLCELACSEIFANKYSRQVRPPPTPPPRERPAARAAQRRGLSARGGAQVVVVGQRAGPDGGIGQRFQLVQPLSADELYTQTDLDLGSRQLERFMWQDTNTMMWKKALLVANFVEYEALQVNDWGVFKCISRIKAEEEIWNKVVDEIFEIDRLVQREKQLRHLSRFVKDVFGIKMVVGDENQVAPPLPPLSLSLSCQLLLCSLRT